MSFKTIEELGRSEEFIVKCSNDPEVKSIWNFFQKFEKDSEPTDLSAAEESYSNSFLFCDPENVNLIKKEDFLKFLPIMTAKYRDIGFKEKEVNEIKIAELDENYLLAKVNWKMKFGKDEKEQEYNNIKATYILKKEEKGYKIILHLDHQRLSDIIL